MDMRTLHQAKGQEQHQHGRSPVTDKRQRNAHNRGKPHHHRHIYGKEQEESQRNTQGQQGREPVFIADC